MAKDGINNCGARHRQPVSVLAEHVFNFCAGESDRFSRMGMHSTVHHGFILQFIRDFVSLGDVTWVRIIQVAACSCDESGNPERRDGILVPDELS